jgi:hypothetical protein
LNPHQFQHNFDEIFCSLVEFAQNMELLQDRHQFEVYIGVCRCNEPHGFFQSFLKM